MAATETGTSLEVRTQQVVANLENPAFLEQVEALLPDTVPLKRFAQVAKTAILNRPDLVEADQTTLFGAILRAAQDGLMPDGRESVINAYNTKIKVNGVETWIKKAEYLPMIYGLRKRFAEHGWALRTELVREGDEFEDFSSDGYVVHRKPRPGVERGEIEGAYAMAVHKDGRREAVVMSKTEIDEVRDKASKNNRAWVEWYPRMAEKTPGQRLAKKVGLDPADRQPPAPIIAEIANEDAAELLYGPTPVPAVEPLAGETTDSTNNGGASQQAPAADTPPAAGAPGDDIEDGEFEVVDESPLGEITAAEFAAAASTRFSGGAWDKKTFAQVAEAGEDGRTYLAVRLKKVDIATPNGRKLAVFVHEQMPDVWQQYVDAKAAQS